MSGEKEIRVLVVDDSALARTALVGMLSSDSRIAVIGAEPDPFAAARSIAKLLPDVILLDLEMPRMSGLTFLRKLMQQHPIPTVVCSAHAERGSRAALEVLAAGAVDLVPKPRLSSRDDVAKATVELLNAIHGAADKHFSARRRPREPVNPMPRTGTSPYRVAAGARNLVAVGASTGGTEAIAAVLRALPPDFVPVVIAQHMPARFTAAFAEWLDESTPLCVREATGNEQLRAGLAVVAPGDSHLRVVRRGNTYWTSLAKDPPVNRHRPSVDVLFDSVVDACGGAAVGVLLTGMGEDGARGLRRMADAGAHTIAQDERTSVVFGMPKAAIDLEAACEVQPLERVGPTLIDRVMPHRVTSAAASAAHHDVGAQHEHQTRR